MDYTYTTTFPSEGELVETANQIKRLVLVQLERDGIIESADDLDLSYLIIMNKKGRLGKVWDKFFGYTDKDNGKTSLAVIPVRRK